MKLSMAPVGLDRYAQEAWTRREEAIVQKLTQSIMSKEAMNMCKLLSQKTVHLSKTFRRFEISERTVHFEFPNATNATFKDPPQEAHSFSFTLLRRLKRFLVEHYNVVRARDSAATTTWEIHRDARSESRPASRLWSFLRDRTAEWSAYWPDTVAIAGAKRRWQ